MHVFISWSGRSSKAVAELLRVHLRSAIQALTPFMSSADINAGARWRDEIGEALGTTNFGIIVVTPDNVDAPWLNFEAGALAKTFDSAHVVPVLVGMHPGELAGPLSAFQSVTLDRDGMSSLVTSLNDAIPDPLPPDLLQRAFEQWWPVFETKLTDLLHSEPPTGGSPVGSSGPTTGPLSGATVMLAEILTLVRRLDAGFALARSAQDSDTSPRTSLRKIERQLAALCDAHGVVLYTIDHDGTVFTLTIAPSATAHQHERLLQEIRTHVPWAIVRLVSGDQPIDITDRSVMSYGPDDLPERERAVPRLVLSEEPVLPPRLGAHRRGRKK